MASAAEPVAASAADEPVGSGSVVAGSGSVVVDYGNVVVGSGIAGAGYFDFGNVGSAAA